MWIRLVGHWDLARYLLTSSVNVPHSSLKLINESPCRKIASHIHWGAGTTLSFTHGSLKNDTHYANDNLWCIFMKENFWFKFHWSLSKGPIDNNNWFSERFGAKQATSQYLNHWWSSSLTHMHHQVYVYQTSICWIVFININQYFHFLSFWTVRWYRLLNFSCMEVKNA